jgi:Tfp pilus assembly protein PilF
MLRALFAHLLPKPKPVPVAEAPQGLLERNLEQMRSCASTRDWQGAAAAAGAVLALEPQQVEALLVKARSLRARGRIEEAKQAYRAALVLEPRRADAWLDLGVCYHMGADDFWARVYFRFAHDLDPNNAQVWNEFGVVEISLGNFEQAEQSLENAVNRNPELAEAWNNLGLVLARRGDLANARRHFLRATFLSPQHYMAHCNLGLACRELELEEEAAQALRRAIEIDASRHTARLNLAMVLQDQGKLEEALEMLEQALAAAPRDADVLAAMSALQLRRGAVAEAQQAARRALELDPQSADAQLALAYAHLSLGDFARGWEQYEARLRSRSSPAARFSFAHWRGEELAGKSVLVYGEQGLGDEIMFASCLPQLAALAARCSLACSPRLAALFRRSFPQVEVVDSVAKLEMQRRRGERSIDFSLAIGSLPLLFRRHHADFPSRGAYLCADEARTRAWRERLAALGPGLKVGIAWRGGLLRTGQVQRSLDLAGLAPLLRAPNVHWVSLQHGRAATESDERITAWDEAIADLDETAALMSALDLVVTVCSTVVHLSGALGRPVWVLTPRAPAWRYLMEGERLPWYPSARLFRQRDASGWSEVLERVSTELERLASKAP